ncbi:hypothetical protein HHK36_019822 [Tetracentron sinense]|uniref:MI domain-containing protein n=1 Tax=Tetracentron sinense TaxID=13715 RepID=A0A835DCM2_TETSI|nr:hypothetical protein HHK36_019822 [Tetracentron sinense]
MVSKYSRESSDDDDVVKKGREKSIRHSSKTDSRSNSHRRDERNSSEPEAITDVRSKNRIERNDERDDEIRENSRVRDRRRNGNRERRDSRRSSDDDDEKLVDSERDRRERKRSHRHENGHRQQEPEEDRKHRDRHSREDSEDMNDREKHKKSERERERRGDDRHHRRRSERRNGDDDTHKRGEGMNEHREDFGHSREKGAKELGQKGGDSKAIEDSKSQRPSILQDGNMNTDAAKLGRSGGIYIPPFKLARMMKEVEDKSSVEYQRLTWDALRKSINGLVNKVNATNIKNIIPELFAENLIRGRGLFCRSCMKSQMASPGFTDVFSALVAVVNTKFPAVGELLLRRIVLQLKRAYKRNDKPQLLAAVKFVAHLVNQQVAHEIIALELLTVLLENPTDDSVEVAVGFVTECGSLLQDLSPQGLHGIFERFRGILHEGEIDKRVQFLIEGLFAIRKAKFQGYPAVRPELDLVEQEDQLTHELSLELEIDPETSLDIFKPDPQFVDNEKQYEELKKNILGEESSEDEASSDASTDDEDDEESEEEDDEQMKIKDETETNLINLRRTIYLTIMSSVDFEEAGHKLLKIKLEPGQEHSFHSLAFNTYTGASLLAWNKFYSAWMLVTLLVWLMQMELCIMLLECCSQERTYLRYYGLLGQRFCMINKIHQENFEKCFVQQYSMIHRLETNKLRNVAKFFAHLLGTDALPWHVLAYIRLTEEDTTSSSRIFIKILFQELSEHLGIRLLNERLTDPTMQDSFDSIFPKDNPKNTRFSINFFTSIGLGGITENLRESLKNMPRLIMQQQKLVSGSEDKSGSSSQSSSDSSGSESESDSSSSDESEGDERRQKRRRRD